MTIEGKSNRLRLKTISESKFDMLKASFFSRKPFEPESLAEVQFLIDSCHLLSQSHYLNNSIRKVGIG